MTSTCSCPIRSRRIFRTLRSVTSLVVMALFPLAQQAHAQTGTIVALARNDQGAALDAVVVVVRDTSGGVVTEGVTAKAGRVALRAPVGTYVVEFRGIGWRRVRVEGVEVQSGASTAVEVTLEPTPIELDPITVTTSRREEKLLAAPASIRVLDRQALQAEPALSITDHVEAVAGVDVMRTGIQEANIVVRGFNSLLTSSTLTLIDNRPAGVPGLRNNTTRVYAINSFDLERVEVVRGPGSALYGLNAAQGVVHMITRSPIDDPGYEISLASGFRQQGEVPGFAASTGGIMQFEGRLAHRFSNRFGAKVSGRWFLGRDWRFQDTVEVENGAIAGACLGNFQAGNPACQVFAVDPTSPPDPEQLARINSRNFDLGHWTFDGRVDWRPQDDVAIVLNTGLEYTMRALDMSAAGMVQVNDHVTHFAQARLNWADFYGQVFFNRNRKIGGESTFFLRNGSEIPDESWNLGLQLQHATDLGTRQRFVYGADLTRVVPESGGSLHGTYENNDVYTEGGIYLQSETNLGPRWDLSTALRSDWHSILDETMISPRLALVFTPAEGHSVRATYNRAFATPRAIALHADVMAQRIPLGGPFTYDVRIQGTAGGLTFARAGNEFAMRSPWGPLVGTSAASPIPATTEQLYVIARELLRAAGSPAAGLMDAVGVPASADVGVDLRMLNLATAQFDLLPGGFDALADLPALRAEATETVEVGYKGILADRLLITADVYYMKKKDYIGPFLNATPNVFLNGEDLVDFFTAQGVDEATARALAIGTPEAPGLSTIPLGVATFNEATSSGAGVVLAARNFGDVDLVGADLELGYRPGTMWQVGLALSWASDNLFEGDGIEVPLNAPKFKTGLSVGYDDRLSGRQVGLRHRYFGGFPASDGVYAGTVDDYHLMDLNVGFRLPGMPDAKAQIEVQNLSGTGYSPFPGVPEMGRVVMVRLEYRF